MTKKAESDVLTKTFFVGEIQKVYGAVALNRTEFTEQMGKVSKKLGEHDKYFQVIFEKIDALDQKIDEKTGNLDRKIDGVRQSSKEHLESVEHHLSKRMDGLEMKIDAVHDKLNHKIETVRAELGDLNGKMDRVVEKVEENDKDIRILKAAVA